MPIKRLFGIDPARRVDVPNGLRGSGVTGGKGLFDKFFNQIILELVADHVVNTETKVKAASPIEGTTYFNSTAGEFQDKDDVATVFLSGQKIAWAGLDAITDDIDLSAFDDITHDYLEGVTIAFGSQNILLGSNQIGFLNCTGTGDLSATDSPEFVVNNKRTAKLPSFGSKNLILSNASVTTTDSSADYIRLLDVNNNAFPLGAFSETFDITTDLNAGSEKASTRYQHWIACDFLGNIQKKMVPDITGVTDGISAGFLVDSTNTFFTDKVQAGDIIFNFVEKTTVKTTPTVDGANIEVVDDIFVSGQDYVINIETPQFDSGKVFKAKLGSDFNDASSNLKGDILNDSALPYTEYHLDTPSGQGSSSTAITEYTNVVLDINNRGVVKVETTTTFGTTIEAIIDCHLFVEASHRVSAGSAVHGFSRNSNQLSTALHNITALHRVSRHGGIFGTATETTFSGFLKKGEIVRHHVDPASTDQNLLQEQLIVFAVGANNAK